MDHGKIYNIGDRIQGRWQITEIYGGAGKSGVGIVYIVKDLTSREVYAVKTIQSNLSYAKNLNSGIRNEAEFWLQLPHHPNIVDLKFIETIGTQIAMFMEYIPCDDKGRNTLSHFLSGSPLHAELVHSWASGICDGLQYAYAHGLNCHRDLKPDNLLIDTDKNIKITDFGLANVHLINTGQNISIIPGNKMQNQTNQSIVNNFIGTPGYMAPEIIIGNRGNAKSDIYSFGLILHQMVAGNIMPPLCGVWRGDIISFELENYEIRKNTKPSPVGSNYDFIIQKCLSFNPEYRYDSFLEVLTDLRDNNFYTIPREINRIHLYNNKERLLEKSISSYRLGHIEEALQYIREARNIFGPDATIWNSEGVFLSDLNRYEEALQCFNKSIDIDHTWVMSWNNKGRTLKAMGQYEEALESYSKAIECDPTHSPPWTNKGNCHHDLKQFDDAIRCYNRALDLDRNYLEAWSGKGKCLKQIEKIYEAYICYKNAYELEPANESIEIEVDILRNILINEYQMIDKLLIHSESLYLENNIEDALNTIIEAKNICMNDKRIWNMEGVCRTDLGDYSSAIDCFNQSIIIDRSWTNSWCNKGRTFRIMKKYSDAIICYNNAIECDRNQVTPWINKGNCLMYIDKKDEALSCYRFALQLDPDNEEVKQFIQNNSE